MWSATVGAMPVNWFTWAASETFSYGSRGTPRWAKTLKRVPELPNAHDGSSIRCERRVATTAESNGGDDLTVPACRGFGHGLSDRRREETAAGRMTWLRDELARTVGA